MGLEIDEIGFVSAKMTLVKRTDVLRHKHGHASQIIKKEVEIENFIYMGVLFMSMAVLHLLVLFSNNWVARAQCSLSTHTMLLTPCSKRHECVLPNLMSFEFTLNNFCTTLC